MTGHAVDEGWMAVWGGLACVVQRKVAPFLNSGALPLIAEHPS